MVSMFSTLVQQPISIATALQRLLQRVRLFQPCFPIGNLNQTFARRACALRTLVDYSWHALRHSQSKKIGFNSLDEN